MKTLRLQANLSQSELAQILGISRSAVSSYENGTREPNYDVLLKIAAFFNVSTDYLLGHETQQSHPNPIVQLAQDFQRLLDTSDVSTETKTEILNELKEYLQWKLAQFSKNQRLHSPCQILLHNGNCIKTCHTLYISTIS